MHSNAFTPDGGYALGVACGTRAPRQLSTFDFGLPAPICNRTASAIVAVRSPLRISYFGAHRYTSELDGEAYWLPSKGLTSSDVILLLVRGPHSYSSSRRPRHALPLPCLSPPRAALWPDNATSSVTPPHAPPYIPPTTRTSSRAHLRASHSSLTLTLVL